jgi:uncharacterized protein (TIGR00369 family)
LTGAARARYLTAMTVPLASMQHPQLALVRELPLHKHLGVRVLDSSDGQSLVELPVSAVSANPSNVLHGGIIYTVCDIAAYVALLTMLAPAESAVTHDLHVSCLRPAPIGTLVRFEGKVVQRGKRLAFVDVTATLEGKVIATARVTKSIVSPP